MSNMNKLAPSKPKTIDLVNASLAKRHASEKLFRYMGLISILMGLMFLFMLFYSIVSKGYTAFQQTFIQLEVNFDEQLLDPEITRHHDVLSSANYGSLIKKSLSQVFPDVRSRNEKRLLYNLISIGATYQLRDMVMDNSALIGQTLPVWVPADDDVDMLIKGHTTRDVPETERRLLDMQISWLDQLAAKEKLTLKFNTAFFINGDSRDPELAGIWGAFMGSIYTLLVTLILSFPMGVATAVYLEEFAPKISG